ncbi:MAG: nucleoside hydrolase [Planctomycetes bacterium]|nr:nucleoside hydrolase [Planctomycetota bacterium]
MTHGITARLALLVAVMSLGVAGLDAVEAKRPPANVIFDCDMGNDCDDAGALALLNALADDGEARILACMMWKMRKDGPVSGPAAVIDAINTYYGRPDIPIGIGKKGVYVAGATNYTNTLGKDFPNDTFGKSIDDFPEAIDLYRQVLAAQPDRSVTIVCVGPHTSIKHLLASGPDASSPLSGRELVAQKVALLSLMGGKFPEGDEFNLGCDLGGAMAAALEWPGRVIWSGLEIGGPVITGPGRIGIPKESPLHAAYKPYGGQRQSWDLTAVLAAVRGPAPYWGLSTTPGHYCVVPSKSIPGYTHHWEGRSDRDQTYLVLRRPASEAAAAIDGLLQAGPSRPVAPATAAAAVILDTSLANADEAGALALVHALADRGEAELLGCIFPGRSGAPLQAIDAINTSRGRPDIPIGMMQKGDWVTHGDAVKGVAASFPQDVSPGQLPESVALYRRLLAARPDRSVTIVCTGSQNALAQLLESKPDELSPLAGRALAAQKVKVLVVAGGQYPDGGDYAYAPRTLASAMTISVAWPSRVVYVGREIATQIRVGAPLAQGGSADPLRPLAAPASETTAGAGAMAAVLYGVRGAAPLWDDTIAGACYIQPASGGTRWLTDLSRDQAYLTAKMPAREIEQLLNRLIARPPVRR